MHSPKSCLFYILLASLFFTGCEKSGDKSSNTWQDVKSNAKESYVDAVESSKDKWDDLKNLSSEEWEAAGKSIIELKNKAVKVGEETRPKFDKLVNELESLQSETDQKLKEFRRATGDNVEDSKVKLEKSWKKLQDKMQELSHELKSDD